MLPLLEMGKIITMKIVKKVRMGVVWRLLLELGFVQQRYTLRFYLITMHTYSFKKMFL